LKLFAFEMGRGPELSPTIRARICELESLGWSYNKIHQKHPGVKLGTIKSTVRLEKFRQNNQSRPRSGAPRKVPEEDRDFIYDTITHSDPYIKHRDLLSSVDDKVKARSLRYLLRELGKRK
jgi:transposase